MSRGNARMAIFLDDADYRQFLRILGDVAAGFDLECWNYCLMPNHYHATIRPRGPNLSEAIRRLNSVYAQWWNRRHGRVGHVFQGRFKAQIVAHDDYLLTLSRYVVMNPVRAGLAKDAAAWRWSSYRAMAGLAEMPDFLKPSGTLSLFGQGSDTSLREQFVSFIKNSVEDLNAIEQFRSERPLLA